MAYIARITIFPIKSLDGVEVERTEVLPGGALRWDRQWAIFDARNRFVNGKRTAAIHRLRARFDLTVGTVVLSAPDGAPTPPLHLHRDRRDINTWLSDYFEQPVEVRENVNIGFPDDTDSPGPTVVSTATLEATAGWFPNLDAEQMRLRLRTNLEIDGVPPFWEDRLFGAAGEPLAFAIGTVPFLGINPCQRCIVPTRDPQAGTAYPEFPTIFSRRRQETLPDWANADRFNHFYRLCVNTRVPAEFAGGVVAKGDAVALNAGSSP
ncbi:putative Fe-S protein [Rubidibacter lacunae KORDI 51-2]|uniref:Putative Fe-S protein n=1 Tax=Rubidibacter lacunae KORDI 51-2 TaxID=582515 RepID=U5DDM3_9CHRO|nr:MOSC N-terminal beta barrel domain-containing protein [Rubidibacter lacunae]ERN42598.1 putative Fe-S protein [Rubidibacter lacunae KORDI 51-2]